MIRLLKELMHGETNNERIVKQSSGKAYKVQIITLAIPLCALVIYILIVGIDHVLNESTCLLSVCFTTFYLLVIAYTQHKRAKRILKEKASEAEKSDEAEFLKN